MWLNFQSKQRNKMGWFNSKKEKSPDEKAMDLLMQKIFPGGDPERITRATVVSGMCGHKLDFKEAVYVYSKIKGNFEIAVTLFNGVTKKGISAEQLVQDAIKDSQGKLNYFEAVAVVSYALFGREESSLVNFETLKTYLAGLFGSDEQGYDADVIPFAIGEFGLEPTNPVPVRGIGGSRAYLDKLRLAGGQPVTSKRIRALKVDDANISAHFPCAPRQFDANHAKYPNEFPKTFSRIRRISRLKFSNFAEASHAATATWRAWAISSLAICRI
jgi:hypothetical protein